MYFYAKISTTFVLPACKSDIKLNIKVYLKFKHIKCSTNLIHNGIFITEKKKQLKL